MRKGGACTEVMRIYVYNRRLMLYQHNIHSHKPRPNAAGEQRGCGNGNWIFAAMLVPARGRNDDECPPATGEHYTLLRKIGQGSFGSIYLGRSDKAPGQLVAVKFESVENRPQQLADESRAYKLLQSCIARCRQEIPTWAGDERANEEAMCEGIPRAYHYGMLDSHNYLVLDFLGPSLEDVFDACGRRFSVRTTSYLALQMVTRIQTIHKHGLIYRDIKPDNFLLGRGGEGDAFLATGSMPIVMGSPASHTRPSWRPTVYIVDFGMVKHYLHPRTLEHIPFREKKSLSGTARYMSVNTHRGWEQSRRDDLEALGYVLVYFLRGSLPWQGIPARDNVAKYERIGQRKQTTTIADLCAGLPQAFGRLIAYARSLEFDEAPDYNMIREWFSAALKEAGEDGPLDWDRLPRLPGPSVAGLLTDEPRVPGSVWPASPAVALPAAAVPPERPAPRRSFLRRLFCS